MDALKVVSREVVLSSLEREGPVLEFLLKRWMSSGHLTLIRANEPALYATLVNAIKNASNEIACEERLRAF